MNTCAYCDESFREAEAAMATVTCNGQVLHRECAIRMVAGSAAHILGECSCFGGIREDPPGMSKRQAARLALQAFEMVRNKVCGEAL